MPTGDVRAETTSGDVSLLGVTSRSVFATTVSGEVEYDGTIDANGRYEFHSHSGDIRLEIPESLERAVHSRDVQWIARQRVPTHPAAGTALHRTSSALRVHARQRQRARHRRVVQRRHRSRTARRALVADRTPNSINQTCLISGDHTQCSQCWHASQRDARRSRR